VNSWKVILATMVIFGAGVITGGLLVRHVATPVKLRPPRLFSGNTNAPAANVTPAQLQRIEFLVRANRELDLSTEQRERIEKILRDGQERSRKIWESVAPDMRKELQSVREKIRAELSPEQRHKFEELMKRTARPAGRAGEQPPRERLRPPISPSTTNTAPVQAD
jgi:hypothetical protein